MFVISNTRPIMRGTESYAYDLDYACAHGKHISRGTRYTTYMVGTRMYMFDMDTLTSTITHTQGA